MAKNVLPPHKKTFSHGSRQTWKVRSLPSEGEARRGLERSGYFLRNMPEMLMHVGPKMANNIVIKQTIINITIFFIFASEIQGQVFT